MTPMAGKGGEGGAGGGPPSPSPPPSSPYDLLRGLERGWQGSTPPKRGARGREHAPSGSRAGRAPLRGGGAGKEVGSEPAGSGGPGKASGSRTTSGSEGEPLAERGEGELLTSRQGRGRARGRSRTPRPALGALGIPKERERLPPEGGAHEQSRRHGGVGSTTLQRLLDLQGRIESKARQLAGLAGGEGGAPPLAPHDQGDGCVPPRAGSQPEGQSPSVSRLQGSRSERKRVLRARVAQLEKKMDLFQVKALTDIFLNEAHTRRPR